MPSDPTCEEIKRAWEYHRDADSLLHQRMNGFYTAQAFFFVAYATLLVSPWGYNIDFVIIQIVTISLSIVSLKSTSAHIKKNESLTDGLSYLKRNYLSFDQVYVDYLSKGEKKIERDAVGVDVNNKLLLTNKIPSLFLWFWCFILLLHVVILSFLLFIYFCSLELGV